MESFYGGRKGISFVIVERFDGLDIPQPNENGDFTFVGNYYAKDDENDVFLIGEDSEGNKFPIVRTPENEKEYIWEFHYHDGDKVQEGSDVTFPYQEAKGMKQCFEKGGESTREVGYGEYVIIDTIQNYHNYSHLDNGKIYRRGMDHQAELGGAEYIGQVIGPQGATPIVDMDLVEIIEKDENSHSAVYEEYKVIDGKTIGGGIVSGKEYDYIKYSWVGLRDAFGNVTGVKIGFTFPYTVIEMVAERVDAYTDPEFTRLTQPIEEGGDNGKPYYYKWKVTIPEGVHGTDSKNIRIEPASDGKGDALWYSEIDYTKKFPKLTDKEIAPYKMIDEESGIELKEDGTFIVNYTYDSPLILEKIIRWIKKDNDNANGVELKEDGTVIIYYNTGEVDEYQNALTWITEASLEETGEFKMLFNNNVKVNNIEKTLEWIRRVEVADDGTLTFYYNTLDEEGNEKVAFKKDKFLKIISDVQINTGATEGEGSQKVVVTYNTGESEEIGNALNYIIDSIVTDEPTALKYGVEPYHLLVYYADPARRALSQIKYPNAAAAILEGWTDLGYIRGAAGGLHFIGNFDDISNLQDENGNWLSPEQVEGWLPEYAGWAYTINEQYIYVYNYLDKVWYSIGNLSVTKPDEVVIIESEAETPLSQTLKENGIWLVTKQIKFAE